MSKRKIGVFTIASKNYLAYVRVLLKSIAAHHPEYSLYLCLADKAGDSFDPLKEAFTVIESENINIRHFSDMAIRYDIMEFNTAIKPFMFRWLLDNTELDSIIYLDPDIRAYSRFDRLESVLSSDVSMVLTPHITRPIEDGKYPNDYNMIQAGVFNLGFAAINRRREASEYIDWWGRRLETQASVDLAKNLFTDQRWCDLAPCFLERLKIFRDPGYNAAYWNLTERRVKRVRDQWQVNNEPLAFFHFSGIDATSETVISKHQDRFSWKDLPGCKPLFDDYRHALMQEGWADTRGWKYAYATTQDGLTMSDTLRQLYREIFPTSQTEFETSSLVALCNEISNFVPYDPKSPVTRLMELIHRRRPDLQAQFNLHTYEGRSAFRKWFSSAAARQYNLSEDFIPVDLDETPAAAYTVSSESSGAFPTSVVAPERSAVMADKEHTLINAERAWGRLPSSVKRLLAPIVTRIIDPANSVEPLPGHDYAEQSAPDFHPPTTQRIPALLLDAPIPPLGDDGCRISLLMHVLWLSRPDLRAAFDLDTVAGRSGFAEWYSNCADAGASSAWQGSAERRASAGNPEGQSVTRKSLPGANLIGYAYAEIGMGEHVRMTAAALERTDVSFGVVNFKVGVASRQGAKLLHGRVVSENRYAANIFHINADQMLVAYGHFGHKFFSDRYNIGYWAWELSKCPPEMLAAVHFVDEIWAPSRFIQKAFSDQTDIPVQYMPLCVTLPEFTRLDRSKFAIPQRAFVFLLMFDFLSYAERKNPSAVIRAFRMAFPRTDANVCLVLKVMNGDSGSQQWVDMMRSIAGDSRILVINQTLTRSEILALLDLSDCFVSLHRSEGFGRGPAEAMYLGKPVIVTNYSGNTDFTLPDNSCLVEFELIPVEDGQYPFSAGQHWADADVEQAAWFMKRLAGDGNFARDLGRRGQAFIQENFNQKKVGNNYESRLRHLGLV